MLWKTHVGSATLYRIEDGRSSRDPLRFLIGSTPETLARFGAMLNEDGSMPNAFSCYLFDSGTHRVLIDTGFGEQAGDRTDAGDMPAGLARLGYDASDIDHVVFTHLHPDHILGSLDSRERPFFPNATHWTVKREIDHWRTGSDERSVLITTVANTLDDAGMLEVADEPGSIVPGVTTEATYGHTPGHVAVRLSSGGETVFVCGDLTFSPIHVQHPEWAFPMDVDPDVAAEARRIFFAAREADGHRFSAGHYGHPGIGRIRRSDGVVQYVTSEVENIE